MKTKIGLVTIGQSPRDDVVPEIAELLGPGVQIFQKGALDGLLKSEIRKLKPGKKDFPLVTKLRDGSTAVLGRRKITPLLKKQINGLTEQGVRLIALLCTDEFPGLGAPGILLQPFSLLFRSVVSLLKEGRLGVIVPLQSQKEATKRKWQKTGLSVVVEALNPYERSPGQDKAIEKMRREEVDLVVLDCIGYSRMVAQKMKLVIKKPVLWPRAALANSVKKLI
jgi:protein AroM